MEMKGVEWSGIEWNHISSTIVEVSVVTHAGGRGAGPGLRAAVARPARRRLGRVVGGLTIGGSARYWWIGGPAAAALAAAVLAGPGARRKSG